MTDPTKTRGCLGSGGIPNAAYKRSWKEIFSASLPNPNDVASRRLLLMSLGRHWEIYPNDRSADSTADAPAHLSDEFPAGYSLTGGSPAPRLRFTSRAQYMREKPTGGSDYALKTSFR